MKKVILFHFAGCPYCRSAEKWLDELLREYPEFDGLSLERIDEKLHPELASQYAYWYVPTFFVDGIKMHEGACTRETVEHVLRTALD